MQVGSGPGACKQQGKLDLLQPQAIVYIDKKEGSEKKVV
jgi:hypothetical protein